MAKKKVILIIDDDAAFARILQLRLKALLGPIEVTTAETLASAREVVQRERGFDLVVLDEHLPDGRGIELLKEGCFQDLAVLCISSDEAPEIPGETLRAGAAYFLNKLRVSEPLFAPLVRGVLDRNRLQRELGQARVQAAVMDTVRTLVTTLRHEINNPLGAVLGAAYILRSGRTLSEEQLQAAELVESSGQRISHVLEQLCRAVQIDRVKKGDQEVFHVPGDAEWKEK